MDLTALKTELTTDPAGLGYAALVASGHTAGLADLLNAPNAAIRVNRGVIEAYRIVNAIVPGDWAALTAAQKQSLQLIISAGQVDVSDVNVRQAFVDAFGAGTATRAALVGLATRDGSRAEQVLGQPVSHLDVARALREEG
jgi:hypothetical protein